MRSPEEGPQHLGAPGLVVGGGDEASGLEDILRGVGHREGQVPLALHRQVVTDVAKDGGLRAVNTEEALRSRTALPLSTPRICRSAQFAPEIAYWWVSEKLARVASASAWTGPMT